MEAPPKSPVSAPVRDADIAPSGQPEPSSTPSVQESQAGQAPTLVDGHPASSGARQRYINRELSQLDFDERVLAMAEDRSRPLLERVRFLAILGENVDQFFQVRVAGLKEQLHAALPQTSPDGMTTGEQLRAIHERADGLLKVSTRLFTEDVAPALDRHGVCVAGVGNLDDADRDYLAAEFEARIFPVLTPLAVDPAHPFPYISHLSLNLAVMVRDPVNREMRFARVKVPPLLPRFIPLPDGKRFIPLEQVISLHVDELFPGMDIVSQHPFRVTRDADLDVVDEEAADLLAAIQSELRRQQRRAQVVRLEVDAGMSEEVLDLLVRELELEPTDVYRVEGLLDLSSLWALYALDRPDLKDDPWTPVTQLRLKGPGGAPADIFKVLEDGDVLVHHPYDSFASSAEAFIEQAAQDPDVLAIKQTLYRTSGPVSPIVRSLIGAAESGKQVVALVELKARGDERANIAWAQALEQVGVHVVYGVVGLKTHAKVALVVRREAEGIRRYVHVGTGNYNPKTAQIYEDVGLLSADPELGNDVAELFNFLTGYSRQRRFGRLLVAPMGLRANIIRMIRLEAGRPGGGRIVLKVNALVDPEIVDVLYEASQAGTQIDLIVRGICSLRPGVPGLSENIRVRSLVGRFLEHSRVFRFGPDGDEAAYYLGSSDLMPRNLDRRVEAMVPVLDRRLQQRLDQVIEVELKDDVLAWTLHADGSWTKVETVEGVNAQRVFEKLATERAVSSTNGSLDA
ncbi:MAG TPA: polyphosphate kinase 1 [Candidatus Dormibacteraeota bacterium]|nr:polyphosphate kinase 1 [Candidatus Dormibacteraeota bacterium]